MSTREHTTPSSRTKDVQLELELLEKIDRLEGKLERLKAGITEENEEHAD